MAKFNFRGETTIDNPYADLSGFQAAYQPIWQQTVDLNSDSAQNRQIIAGRLGAVGDEFKNLFTNLVGRAPTNDELNQFFKESASQVVTNSANGLGRSEQDPTGVRNQVAQYVGDTFQKQAQDYATQQLQDQQGQANSLADLFRTQGNAAISSTEQSLLDYQSKLFDRLRPNLITSLQSQGLLNTGGMNEAIAGVQGDLANNASNYIAGLKLQNEQGANQIAFGGASAPYYYKQNLIASQPGQLQAAAQNALGANNQTFMSNLDYQHQLGMIQARMKAQQELQPSFLRTMGQSFADNFGNQAAQAAGQVIKPSSWFEGFGGQ